MHERPETFALKWRRPLLNSPVHFAANPGVDRAAEGRQQGGEENGTSLLQAAGQGSQPRQLRRLQRRRRPDLLRQVSEQLPSGVPVSPLSKLCESHVHVFGCSDPPLEETDIPKGEWLCHSCIHAKKKPQLRLKRSVSMPAEATPKPVAKKQKMLSPIEMLIEAAQAMNPRQFELPRSMSIPCIFPGTDKGLSDCFHYGCSLLWAENSWLEDVRK